MKLLKQFLCTGKGSNFKALYKLIKFLQEKIATQV